MIRPRGIVGDEKVFFLIFVKGSFTFTLPLCKTNRLARLMIRHSFLSFRSCGLAIALGLTASITEARPATDVSPQLAGLHVSYHLDGNSVRTNLYTTNHEAYAVICDAEMSTNMDEKQKLAEIRIPAGKTLPFHFTYGRSITKIRIRLMCVPSEEKAIVEEQGKVDGNTSEQSTDRIVTKKLEKPAGDTSKTIPVENLDQF